MADRVYKKCCTLEGKISLETCWDYEMNHWVVSFAHRLKTLSLGAIRCDVLPVAHIICEIEVTYHVYYIPSFEGKQFDSFGIIAGCHKGIRYWGRLQQGFTFSLWSAPYHFPHTWPGSIPQPCAHLPSALTFHWKVFPEPCVTRVRSLHLTSGLNISMPTTCPWILLLALFYTLNHSLRVMCSRSPEFFMAPATTQPSYTLSHFRLLLWGHSLSIFSLGNGMPPPYPSVSIPLPHVPSEVTSLDLVWAQV